MLHAPQAGHASIIPEGKQKDGSSDDFTRVSEAYQVLFGPVKRQVLYAKALHEGLHSGLAYT